MVKCVETCAIGALTLNWRWGRRQRTLGAESTRVVAPLEDQARAQQEHRHREGNQGGEGAGR